MSDLSHFWWQSPAGDGYEIGNSLRFRGKNGSHASVLQRSVSKVGSGTKMTWSWWAKRGTLVDSSNFFTMVSIGQTSGNHRFGTYFDRNGALQNDYAGSNVFNNTNDKYRDPGAWYHIVWTIDTTQASANNRSRFYVNGKAVSDQHTRTLSQNQVMYGNQAGSFHMIGNLQGSNFWPFNGYMAEMHFVDGTALDSTTFGEFNADGVWVPKKVSGLTYGTNGFYLAFDDATNIGKDSSGNGNDFTATGFELTTTTSPNYDWVADSPTQNFATVNPLYPGASTSNASLTTANATGKPTILGLAGNGWDGTESGWTTTGDVDFGQRTAADKISTAKLPAVSIKNPSDHFTTILDSGANILTEAQKKFPNGLWWIKDRVGNWSHRLVDSVNGTGAARRCPDNNDIAYSAPSGNSVAWCWATGPSGADNGGGFSITSGTHGLGETPMFVISRNLSVWHKDIAAGKGMVLANSSGVVAQTWTVNATTVSGPGGGPYWAWREIPGYSAAGTYVGNTNSDGPFVYTGFRPAFVMIKLLSGSYSWVMKDSARKPYNPADDIMRANLSAAETGSTSSDIIDILSNGFKCTSVGSETNDSGLTYIWIAFAEHPFGGSNVSPAPAR